MSVAQVLPSTSRLAGGLFESVRHLSRHLAEQANVELSVIGLSDERTRDDLAAWAPVNVAICHVNGPQAFGYAPTLLKVLRQSAPDIVHLHGLWKYPAVAVNRWQDKSGAPYIVSPRGMIEPWALRQSSLRKQIAMLLFQRRNLQRATCVHATSQQEGNSIRQAGFANPIAVIPNGVEIPKESRPLTTDHGPQTGTALFLSRIHPKKGLLNLIQAWATLRPSGWQLGIVGPDECNYRSEVEAAVQKHGLTNVIHFHDEALGEAKHKFYSESDLFILPSYSENFGLVIAEALAHAVPVITTRATPWSELQDRQCGWWIDVGVEPLVTALKEATALSREQLREMGARGRKLVEEKYSWPQIAQQMLEVYEWALGRRAAPDYVQFD
jgi:glycosyltransferase involved in cell wall biosynthesis